MSVVLNLINHDELYHRLTNEKILINLEDIFNQENKEKLDSMIYKNYSEDNLSIIPSCNCEDLKGEYYIGEYCNKCNSHVTSSLDDNISFLLWCQKPIEVETFINPIILTKLLHRYKITRPNVPLIKYIMLPSYKVNKTHQKANIGQLDKLSFLLESRGIKRGYNSFIRNFYTIIEILEKEFVKDNTDSLAFIEFLHNNKDKLFSNYLPFPNKIIFTMENTELGRFIDKSLLNPINVIRRLTGIDLHTKSSIVKQNKVASSLIDLAEFYAGYVKSSIFGKPGLVRHNISSTRCHFTARAVITSVAGVHEYDEIHIPWSIGCTLFRYHILNQLYKLGYNYRSAVELLQFHNRLYHPILDNIFQSIVASTPYHGIKAFLNRNPSLHRGSIQTVRITKIKTQVDDNTFSMSYLIGPSFNSDLDGDALNLTLALTEKVHSNMDNFEPHHNVLGLVGPNEFSDNLKLPRTIVATLNNWMDS